MPHRLLPLAALFVALATPLAAQGTGTESVRSLRGHRTISIVVEKPEADALRAGVTAAALEAQVIAMLRAGGIRVLPTTEGARLRAPYLHVELTTFSEPGGNDPPMVYMAQVKFKQRACLEHTRTTCIFAATWDTAQAGVGRSLGPENYRQVIDELVGKFVSAHRAANR